LSHAIVPTKETANGLRFKNDVRGKIACFLNDHKSLGGIESRHMARNVIEKSRKDIVI